MGYALRNWRSSPLSRLMSLLLSFLLVKEVFSYIGPSPFAFGTHFQRIQSVANLERLVRRPPLHTSLSTSMLHLTPTSIYFRTSSRKLKSDLRRWMGSEDSNYYYSTSATNSRIINAVRENVLIEAPEMNARRITASVVVDAPIDACWEIITDYNNLSTHVPNLVKSYEVPSPSPSGTRIFQEGAQKIIGFDFRASLTMDMIEEDVDDSRAMTERKLSFKCVESSMFAQFDGTWTMRYHSRQRTFNNIKGEYVYSYKTQLTYSVFVRPKGIVPVLALEWRIREDVPTNLLGVKIASEARALRENNSSSLATLSPSSNPTAFSGISTNPNPFISYTTKSPPPSLTTPAKSPTSYLSTARSDSSNVPVKPVNGGWNTDETLASYINSLDVPKINGPSSNGKNSKMKGNSTITRSQKSSTLMKEK